MSSLSYCLTVLLCLSGIHAMRGHRSCDRTQGTVCIPTACSVSTCQLFSTAVCIDDRCGCEARFFKQLASGQSYQDVTKMCGAANVVLSSNFSQIEAGLSRLVDDAVSFGGYAATYDADSGLTQSDNADSQPWIETSHDESANPWSSGIVFHDEDLRVALAFFQQFNLLVTEIMSDITNYLKTVTEARPTQANIDRLQEAIRTLKTLKRSGRLLDTGRAQDAITEKALFKSILQAIKTTGEAAVPAVTDHGLHRRAENLLAEIINPDRKKYFDTVKSGNVAISDKGAQEMLQEKGIMTNLIGPGWKFIKKLSPGAAASIKRKVEYHW